MKHKINFKSTLGNQHDVTLEVTQTDEISGTVKITEVYNMTKDTICELASTRVGNGVLTRDPNGAEVQFLLWPSQLNGIPRIIVIELQPKHLGTFS